MVNFLYSLIITLSFIFMQMNHPLAMGLTLMIQTIMVCMLTGFMTKTFWFSYILFLIFVGGMLVLFIYISSLASNEMFSMEMKLVSISSLIFLICMIFLNMKTAELWNLNNNEMMTIYSQQSYIKESSIELTKLYNFPTNMLTIMLINYLLISLIAVVKISKLFFGPLRMMY
uniref:NADH-ubiquinone oxidoreductase chain 6 n=1 Tax=Pipunculus sp. XL-2018 TaxID=2321082 RepID=A0A5H2PFX6_9MUSC|nr:NADH dehydrogenase subunit 6 [Pipunculus sp. XL-2018]